MVRMGKAAEVLAGAPTVVEYLLSGWLVHALHPFLRDRLSEPVRWASPPSHARGPD
jgi:hypothetical protein